MSWETFKKIAFLIILAGAVLFLTSTKYYFLNIHYRGNKMTGTIERYDPNTGNWKRYLTQAGRTYRNAIREEEDRNVRYEQRQF